MNSEINKIFADIRKAFEPVIQIVQQLNEQTESFLEENPNFLNNLQNYLKRWPEHHKSEWADVARYRWFVNWETPFSVSAVLPKGKKSLDAFMIKHLTDDWDSITSRVISLYPKRKDILEVAFKLHREGNYIACIPLFLSQIDGICAQNLGVYLFTEHVRRQEK